MAGVNSLACIKQIRKMRKTIILLVLIIATIQNYGQDFAPIGAIWHYTQWTTNPNVTSYKTIESISDTSINGIQCRKMIEVERYLDTTNVIYHYMYSENDSVFFFAQNDFHLLYDFGANAGDTIVLEYFNTGFGTPLQMIIDSTGTILVSGQERKIQHITCGDGFVIEFGNHVIDGIGNSYFMFPTNDLTMNGPLRCYQEDGTNLFINPFHGGYGWNHQDCEEITTDIEETTNKERIFIFPNPTNSIISIQNIDRTIEYKICNMSGEIVVKGITSESNEISLAGLANGIYFIELKNDNVLIVKKIIKN